VRTDGGVVSLDHVVVAVADLEARARETAALLGREVSWRGTHPALGSANALFRLENTYLELLAPAGEGTLATALRARLETAGEGLLALAFGTEDAAALARRLRGFGLEADAPRPGAGRDDRTGATRRWQTVGVPLVSARGVGLFAIEHAADSAPLPPAECTAAAEASVRALDHVVLMTPDLAAARRLYGEVLGVRLALDRSFEARGQRILFFRVGGATVEVVGPAEPPADAVGPDRLWGLAWRVDDVEAAAQRVGAAGFDVSGVRSGAKPGTAVCTLRGEPAGVATLLIGPERPA
jgi:catechol 2,3-dioxygenase-like lactoylglutathione lyase family enzyme